MELSEEYGLYRQDYCGCIFSRAERDRRKAAGQQAAETQTAKQRTAGQQAGTQTAEQRAAGQRPEENRKQ